MAPNKQSGLEKSKDEYFMAIALNLAKKAKWATSPNPAVGAVVVKNGRIIGMGYHKRPGCPHAEVEALREAGSSARGASMYVTLEPCNHVGRTGPCCDAILSAGISRVLIGAKDPNPVTNGRGIRRLRRSGVLVKNGILKEQVQELNRPFWKAMKEHLPFTVAKIGQSLDGKIATVSGQSRWITSSASRRMGHIWRSRLDAVLVGINTILKDDPLLNVRGLGRKPRQPVKLILDSRLRMPLYARCISQSSGNTIIATTSHSTAKRLALERRGAKVLVFRAFRGRVPMKELFRTLVTVCGIHSVLIEGGAQVLSNAFANRLINRVVFFISPILIGGHDAPSVLAGEGARLLSRAIKLDEVVIRRFGQDLCVEGRVVYPKNKHMRQSCLLE